MKVCPTCKKEFSTKGALKSHVADVHSKPPAKAPAKATRPRKRRKRGRGGVSSTGGAVRTVSGSGLVGTISVSSNDEGGTLLHFRAVNPHTMADSRLSAEASLWELWRPKRVRFYTTTGVSSIVSGSVCLAWSPSTKPFDASGDGAVQRVSGMKPSQTVAFGKAASITVPLLDRTWKQVASGHNSESDWGRLLVVLATQLQGAGGAVSILLHAEYEIEFSGPTTVDKTTHAVYAAQGGYFTTSLGGWASGKGLTLKNHAGGSPVTFPGLRPKVVYKLDSQASLKYLDAASAEKDVKYMTSMRNPAYPEAVAVFATAAKARKYAEGDDSAVLAYTKAGPWVSPDNPRWAETDDTVDLEVEEEENGDRQDEVAELRSELHALRLMVQELVASIRESPLPGLPYSGGSDGETGIPSRVSVTPRPAGP